ncbi:MAG: hypothetical protein IT287_04210 [Bdellovibrionaceae bacterium]|nr:hypothetical protein [Pseudobdellovibrionaceae bacterium]
MKTNFCFAFLACIIFAACQSSPQEAFINIPIGAKKGEVLAVLGSPVRTYRKGDVDRWVYKQQSESGTLVFKELWIKDGIVVQKEIPEQSAKPKKTDFEELP